MGARLKVSPGKLGDKTLGFKSTEKVAEMVLPQERLIWSAS